MRRFRPTQGYDQRYIAGGGAVYFLIEDSFQYLAVNLGAVYNREYVTGDSNIDSSAEAIAAITYELFKRRSHSPNLQVSLQTFPSLTEQSRVRAQFKFTLQWSLIKNFQFSFEINNRYDSQPPGDDGNNNDLSVVNSVGYTF